MRSLGVLAEGRLDVLGLRAHSEAQNFVQVGHADRLASPGTRAICDMSMVFFGCVVCLTRERTRMRACYAEPRHRWCALVAPDQSIFLARAFRLAGQVAKQDRYCRKSRSEQGSWSGLSLGQERTRTWSD